MWNVKISKEFSLDLPSHAVLLLLVTHSTCSSPGHMTDEPDDVLAESTGITHLIPPKISRKDLYSHVLISIQ